MTMRVLSLVLAALAALGSSMPASADTRNIVLVHGAAVDGSYWRGVHDVLVADGYRVAVVQLPLTSLDDDVAATRRVLDAQDGAIVLVGHSYGGAVVTVAGTDPDVTALVYVAALQPDVGESVTELMASMPADTDPNAILVGDDGTFTIRPTLYHANVAADVPKATADFLAVSQVPTGPAISAAEVGVAAWRDKPSYAVLTTRDRILSPALQRFMYRRSGATIAEVEASHSVHISQPKAVAAVIAKAARAEYPTRCPRPKRP